MLDMLKQTGRPEMVVGWYHSHPGWGCWLSSVDMNTQQVCFVTVFDRFGACFFPFLLPLGGRLEAELAGSRWVAGLIALSVSSEPLLNSLPQMLSATMGPETRLP